MTPANKKIEGSKAQDGKYVRGVNNEWVAAHGEDGRYRVYGKDEVGTFDDQEDNEQRRGCPFSVLFYKKSFDLRSLERAASTVAAA